MTDPNEKLRELERQLEATERQLAAAEEHGLERRRPRGTALAKLGGLGRATVAVGIVVLAFAAVGLFFKLLPLLIVAGVVYGVYRVFYAPDGEAR